MTKRFQVPLSKFRPLQKKVIGEEEVEIRKMAHEKCRQKHPHHYESLICVGHGSAKGFSPPCTSCLEEARKEKGRENKLMKSRGKLLSDEEAEAVRKKLGIK